VGDEGVGAGNSEARAFEQTLRVSATIIDDLLTHSTT
jgi:hypothetical protein